MRRGTCGRRGRILAMCLLAVSVLAPLLLLHRELPSFSELSGDPKGPVDDVSSFAHLHIFDRIRAIKEDGGAVKEPTRVVYKDEEFSFVDSRLSDNKNGAGVSASLLQNKGSTSGDQEKDRSRVGMKAKSNLPLVEKTKLKSSERVHLPKQSDEMIRRMKDQIILAKAYLQFVPTNSNSHLVKDLRTRIRDSERAIGEASKDSHLHRSALQRMRSMDSLLTKAGRIYPDCFSLSSKLRAMAASNEEQLRAQRIQTNYLTQLAARTYPKGLHCLSLKLTVDYFALQPDNRGISHNQKLKQRDLYHYAVFSDNLLACAVVVNSTVTSSKVPEKMVFHVVTDSINLPAISMWFITNPPGKATIEALSVDDFKPTSTNHKSILTQNYSHDPRFKSPLNYLRFYLPELFPQLDKIVFLDHDVVVQKDLSALWKLNMRGKVVGAIESCGDDEGGFSLPFEALVNFSDPLISKNFNAEACSWAFGMNIFDLDQWRQHDLTNVYHRWLQLGRERQLWKDGSTPIGMMTFYDHVMALDGSWHIRGLGMKDINLGHKDVEKAAVIHYNGVLKPWLEIGIARYKGYWSKFVPYAHPFLQQCNIHP